MHARRSQRTAAPGFSMLELIVVMVIAGIIAAVAAPTFSNIASTRRAMAANVTLRDLDYARERAISSGTRCWVVFSTGTNSYSILAENPSSPGRVGAIVLSDPASTGRTYVTYFSSSEFAGVTLQSAAFGSGSEIGFDWLGRPYDYAQAALTTAGVVTFTGGTTVTVQPGTGLVSTP